MLLPKIFIIGTDEYTGKRSNLINFIKNVSKVDKERSDPVYNVLLEGTIINESNIESFNRSIDRLENLENGILDDYSGEYLSTDVGHALYENNISEINVHKLEKTIEIEIEKYRKCNPLISDEESLMEVIDSLFISKIDNSKYTDLSRMKNKDAQAFYAMFFSWKIENKPFKFIVNKFIKYWDSIKEGSKKEMVFVGKWGDEVFGEGYIQNWVNINKKTKFQKINLAIVRIKEEDDFLDYNLFKFIEVLNDMKLINDNFYLRLKYGTIDKSVISLINDGFSRGLSELIVSNYKDYLSLSIENSVIIDGNIINNMQMNEESEMLILEAKLNIGL